MFSQFRMSEMNTASPRIPSPLDTAGMMAVVSAPGLAEQGTAQRGLAGGDREEKDPRQRQGAEPAAGGRAVWRAGGRAARPQDRPRPLPSLLPPELSTPIGTGYCRSNSVCLLLPLSLAAGQKHAATIGPAPRYFRL